jgi:hypothetical protein
MIQFATALCEQQAVATIAHVHVAYLLPVVGMILQHHYVIVMEGPVQLAPYLVGLPPGPSLEIGYDDQHLDSVEVGVLYVCPAVGVRLGLRQPQHLDPTLQPGLSCVGAGWQVPQQRMWLLHERYHPIGDIILWATVLIFLL